MLAEITGSLRAMNVRDNMVRDISTPYFPHSPLRTVHIVGGEYGMSDEQLSIRDYLRTEHYFIGSIDDHISSQDAMLQGTCIDARFRMRRWNIEHGR